MPETIIKKYWGKGELIKIITTKDKMIDAMEEKILKLEKDKEFYRSENLDQRNHIIYLNKKLIKLGQ